MDATVEHVYAEPSVPPVIAITEVGHLNSSTELNKDLGDPDIAFVNYLLALMKDLPIQERKKLQCQFIASVKTAQDLE